MTYRQHVTSFFALMMVYWNRNVIKSTFFHIKFFIMDYFVFQYFSSHKFMYIYVRTGTLICDHLFLASHSRVIIREKKEYYREIKEIKKNLSKESYIKIAYKTLYKTYTRRLFLRIVVCGPICNFRVCLCVYMMIYAWGRFEVVSWMYVCNDE